MIEETAQVVDVTGSEAWVTTERRSSCDGCDAKGCGTGALSKVLGAKAQRMRVRNPIQADKGDVVVIGIDEATLVKGSLLVYIVPLVLMLLGGLLGVGLAPQWAVEADALSLLFAVSGFIFGLLLLNRFNRHAENDERYLPVILRKAGSSVVPIKSVSL